MAEAAPVIYVGGEGEEREILPVHVVLQIEHAGETGAGDLRFVPGTIGLLGRKKITQPALHAGSIEVATGTNAQIGRHTSELQSPDHLVCRLLLEKKKKKKAKTHYQHT